MKKAYIACLREDREALISALFSLGEVMLINHEESEQMSEKSAERFKNAEALLRSIKPYAPKKGLLSGRPEYTEEEFSVISEESVSTEEKLRELLNDRDDINAKLSEYRRSEGEMSQWVGFTADAKDICSSEYTVRRVGYVSQSSLAKLTDAVGENAQIEEISTEKGRTAILVVNLLDDDAGVTAALKEFEFEEYKLPVASGTVKDEYDRIVESEKNAETEIGEKENEIKELSQKVDDLSLLMEQYRAECDKDKAPVVVTDRTVYIEGWVRSDRTDKVTEALKQVTDCVAVEYADPEKGEKPPTAAKNSKIITPFEGVTNMYSVPDPYEIDPNPVMAPWYWLIFGMMMGDVGYGLMMVLFGWLFIKFMKPKKGLKGIAQIICFSGISTVIFGVLYGSYFGYEWFPPLMGFNMLNDDGGIIKMLLISCGVGVLHVCTGHIVKAVYCFKHGDWATAIFDNISWVMIIGGICLALVSMIPGIIVAGIGAAMILIFAGRDKPTIFGKATGGLGSLYGITSYLSDILSYSRILALGISTAVIAFVMNTLAEMVMGNGVVGVIFGIIIYIVGHAFNLCMGLLSAYVHDSRLQYIEFYGKFYEGAGTEFKPFSANPEKVDIV